MCINMIMTINNCIILLLSMIPTKIIVVSLLLLLGVCSEKKVQQLNPQKLQTSIQNEQFTFVYFYSATCQFCQQFTPKFEQLAKVYPGNNINFGKIDAVTYSDVASKYDVFSYPTIILFWRGIDLPIHYRQERQVQNMLPFLKSATTPLQNQVKAKDLQKLSKQQRQSGVLFYGNEDSQQNKVVTVLSLVQNYRFFARVDANVTQPYLEVKGEQFYNFDNVEGLRASVRKAFARLFIIQEESWLRIHQQKQPGIVFIDTKNNEKVVKIMQKLALEMENIIFMRIDPSQEEFKPALDALGLQNDEGLYGVDEKAQAKFEASKPYTEQSIRQFIDGVLARSLPIYMKTEKSNHKQKLTRANFEQKMSEPKDIVLFLYREDDRIQRKFLDLFKHLSEHLKNNKNISFLRCNISKNQIVDKLEYDVKNTPWIMFFRNRMRDYPIHFQKQVISKQNVIEFIMENTTFDWEDQWGEL